MGILSVITGLLSGLLAITAALTQKQTNGLVFLKPIAQAHLNDTTPNMNLFIANRSGEPFKSQHFLNS